MIPARDVAGNLPEAALARAQTLWRKHAMIMARSVVLFVLAGLCEIGGGWLVWQWLREGRPAGWGLVGAAILVLYGVIPTLQPAPFGRTYATYAGFFIVLSLLWGWALDRSVPDQL